MIIPVPSRSDAGALSKKAVCFSFRLAVLSRDRLIGYKAMTIDYMVAIKQVALYSQFLIRIPDN